MDDSIRHHHDQCFRGFNALCSVLGREAEYHKELLPEVVSDLFGRFNVWAGNIGAGQQGQASLDFRLREASSVKERVVGLLRSLLESLEDGECIHLASVVRTYLCLTSLATSIVSGSRLPYDQLSSDSDSSTSSLSNTSIQDDPDLQVAAEQFSAEDCARTELQQLQHSIATSVSNLYKISIIIRQSPFPHDRTTKASKIDTSFYEFFDQRHVREKYPAVNAALAKRLGNANSRRRKYFKYREQHRQRLSRRDATKLSAPTETSGQDSQIEANQNVLPSGQQTTPSVVQTVSVVQPSATVQSTRASTFHARDVSAFDVHIFDQHSVAGTNTTSGSVSSMRQEKLAIPPTPESAQDGREFECPYCYTICCLKSSDNYKQNREWKRHVLRDLQPYICTFGGCSQGDRMFERRRDWFGHELQVHRVEWCCNTPGHQAYSTRSEFRIHLKRHGEFYDDDQLDSMIDMFKRPAVESSFSCPICRDDRYQNLSIDRLEEHLGRHLEIICTFALPSAGDAESSSDSIVTQGAVQNDQIITATTTSVHSDGIMNDRDDGSKAHVHPYQDGLERVEGVQEPQQRYIRDVLQFVEETEHGPQSLQFFIAELIATHPDHKLQAIPTNAEEVMWRTLSRMRNASEDKSVNEPDAAATPGDSLQFYGLLQFIKDAKSVIVDEMLIPEDDDRFHALMRKSLAVLTSGIWDYWFPIYGSHQLVMQEPLERLKSKLKDSLPSESVDESDQNLGQSEDSVHEFHGDWNFLQTGTDRRQRVPWVQPLESTAQRSESGSPVGNRSDNGDGSVGRGRTLEDICKWLKAGDQSELLLKIAAEGSPGTAEWVFQNPSYLDLRHGRCRFLLLEGLRQYPVTRNHETKLIVSYSRLRKDYIVVRLSFFAVYLGN